MRPLLLFSFFMFSVSIMAQSIDVRDNSKVGMIVTGSGNQLNVTQVFGKSPEYAELKNKLTRLDTAFARKFINCKKLDQAQLKDLYSDCQKELGDLNTDRDSVAKMEKQFREDVTRLAETFNTININSERLRKAKDLFNEGKIREVQFVMNDKEMTVEGEQLLKEKERLQHRTERTDSLLKIKAQEFLVKAQAKASDYADPLGFDSTAWCYQQSLRYFESPENLMAFADFYRENHHYEQAMQLYPKVIAHPKAETWQKADALCHLGELYRTTGNLDKALQSYTQGHEAYKTLYQKDTASSFYKNNLALSYEFLGLANTSLGNLDKALKFYEEFNSLEKELYAAYPTNVDFKNKLAISYQLLGKTYTSLGNLDKALSFYKELNNSEKQLYAAYPTIVKYKSNLAKSYSELGSTYTSLGNLDKALEFYEKSLEISKELYAAYPTNVDYKKDVAIYYSHLGSTHTSLGNLDKALGFYEKDLEISKELYAAYPNNVEFKNNLAGSYSELGSTYKSLGNLDKALGFYEEYNKLEKELYAAYPNNVDFKNGLAVSYEFLGSTHTSLGNLDKALGFYEDYNKLEKELYAAYPNNVDFKNGLAISYEKLGSTHTSLGNLDKALSFYEEYNKLEKELYAAYPNNVDFKNGLAVSYYKLGEFSNEHKKDKKQAKIYFQEAEKLWLALVKDAPQYAQFKNFLGIVQQDLKNLETDKN